jgi:hypothetical protein
MTQQPGRMAKIRMFLFLSLLAVLVGMFAAAAVASEPFATQHPSIEQQGTKMVAGNGGWSSESGPIEKYVFRFTRNGTVLLKGPATMPKSTNYPTIPENTWPDVADANIYSLQQADYGHQICVEVWGGTHSKYTYEWGEVAYDIWEWGNADRGGGIARACKLVPNPAVAPALASAPTVSGTPMVEETLTADLGQWSGTAPLNHSVRWERCDAAGANCVDTGVTSHAATALTYTLGRPDIGKRMRVTVTTSNAGGTATAHSEPTAAVSDLMPTPTRTSIPAGKVTPPHRLVIEEAVARPSRIARRGPVTFDVLVHDSRGFTIGDAEVFVTTLGGKTFLPSEKVRTAEDGTVTLTLTPALTLRLKSLRAITFVINARRPGDRWVSPRSAKALRVVVPVAQPARR